METTGVTSAAGFAAGFALGFARGFAAGFAAGAALEAAFFFSAGAPASLDGDVCSRSTTADSSVLPVSGTFSPVPIVTDRGAGCTRPGGLTALRQSGKSSPIAPPSSMPA